MGDHDIGIRDSLADFRQQLALLGRLSLLDARRILARFELAMRRADGDRDR